MQTWVDRLKKEYAKGKRDLERYRSTLVRDDQTEQDDGVANDDELAIVDSMIADMQYAIEWMRTGHRPGTSRGIDIRDAYSRSILMDMDLLPAATVEAQESTVTLEQKKALVKILMTLSDRERQCYLLHMAQGMSLAEIGREVKLSKATVQRYVDRAKTKVGQGV